MVSPLPTPPPPPSSERPSLVNLTDPTPPNNKTASKGKKGAPAPAEKKALPKPSPASVKPTPPPPSSAKPAPPPPPHPAPTPTEGQAVAVDVRSVPSIPPPRYTFWDNITPGGRRRRQLAYMENGFRQILGLVQSMRENQQVLFKAFQQLPDAVDSVKKLADHSARQAELLDAMNAQLTGGGAAPLGRFNDTLASMDKTTRNILERAQRSEERLYRMLRRSQRHLAVMTLLLLAMFVGGGVYVLYPEQSLAWLRKRLPVSAQAAPESSPLPAEGQATLEDPLVPPAGPEEISAEEPVPPETAEAVVEPTAIPALPPALAPDPSPATPPVLESLEVVIPLDPLPSPAPSPLPVEDMEQVLSPEASVGIP